MFKTLKSKIYFIAAAGFIFILIVNLFLIYYSNGLKNETINSDVISSTSTGIKTLKGNLLQIIFFIPHKNAQNECGKI